MKKLKTLIALAGLTTVTSAIAAEDAGHFAKGRTQFTVLGGTGYAFDESYLVLGIGAGYYVLDGLNVGLQLEAWLDGDPSLYKITPSINYVLYSVPRIKPYVGAFYRFTEIEDQPSLDSAGGRAGVYLQLGRNGYAGLGAVYESYLDCNTRIYVSCDEVYPEVSFVFSF